MYIDTDHTDQTQRDIRLNNLHLVFSFEKGCVTFPHVHIRLDQNEGHCLLCYVVCMLWRTLGRARSWFMVKICLSRWSMRGLSWGVCECMGCILVCLSLVYYESTCLYVDLCHENVEQWICSWSCEEEAVNIVPAKGTLVKFRVNVTRITKNDKELICDKVMLTCKLEKSRSCCGSEVAET